VCLCVCLFVCVCICVCVYMCVCVCEGFNVSVHECVCACGYVSKTQRERERARAHAHEWEKQRKTKRRGEEGGRGGGWEKDFCFRMYALTLSPMISHARAFSPTNLLSHVWLDSFTYDFSRMSLFTYKSIFSLLDWLSHLCFLTHEPFHVWIYLIRYGLTLSPMLSHEWAYSPVNLLSRVWIDALTSGFRCMSLFTYESTFSRMYWLFHLCFLTHEPLYLWIYFLAYVRTLSSIFLTHEPFHP